jgi:hypothetical protein
MEKIRALNLLQREAGMEFRADKERIKEFVGSRIMARPEIDVDASGSGNLVLVSGGIGVALSFSYGTSYQQANISCNGDSLSARLPSNLLEAVEQARSSGIKFLWTDVFSDAWVSLQVSQGKLWRNVLVEQYTAGDVMIHWSPNYLGRGWTLQEWYSAVSSAPRVLFQGVWYSGADKSRGNGQYANWNLGSGAQANLTGMAAILALDCEGFSTNTSCDTEAWQHTINQTSGNFATFNRAAQMKRSGYVEILEKGEWSSTEGGLLGALQKALCDSVK